MITQITTERGVIAVVSERTMITTEHGVITVVNDGNNNKLTTLRHKDLLLMAETNNERATITAKQAKSEQISVAYRPIRVTEMWILNCANITKNTWRVIVTNDT